jgi:hypothetical protein
MLARTLAQTLGVLGALPAVLAVLAVMAVMAVMAVLTAKALAMAVEAWPSAAKY